MGSQKINLSKKVNHQLESKKPVNFSTFPASLILAACFTGYYTGPALAEGSRELVSSGGNRPFLEWTDLAPTAGIARRTTLKVYVNAGETINLGSSVPNSYDAGAGAGITDIVYRSPFGGQNGSCDVNQATGFGLIDTLIKETAGPLPAAGGYTPCTVVAAETGIYEVEFHAPSFSAVGIGNPTAIGTNVAFPTDGSQLQTVAAWDITVTSGGTPIPGRVYADYLSLNMGGTGGTTTNTSPISSRTYIQTEDGYRYFVDLNGLQPFGFIYFASKRGFTDAAGEPIYRSIQLGTGGTLPAGIGVTPTEKVFLNVPAADLPTFSTSPSGSTWLLAPAAPPPIPTDFTFTGSEGTPNQMGTTPVEGGDFSFNAPASITGVSYTIQIDVNQDGDYNDPIDRILRGVAVGGLNTVQWDGRDGFGNPIAASIIPYGASMTLNGGEVHFPFLDPENNAGGLIIQRQIPTGGSTDTVYYNDTGLTGTTPPNPISALAGVPSSGGAHRFGNFTGSVTEFGNDKGIDTWTYLPSTPIALDGSITVAAANLTIAKTANATNIAAGSPITYTITVTNNGPSTATGATVTDTIPPSITGVNWTCAITAGTGTCGAANGTGNTINTTVNLNSGATATYTVTGTVSPTATGTVTNTATVRRPNDTADLVDNDNSGGTNTTESATNSIDVGPPSADLGITKTANQTSTTAGSAIAYTITVTNNGTSTVNSVTVTDTIPAGLTNPIYTASTGTYDPATGAWTGLTLGTGQSITLTVNATVAANATGELTNTATVAPPAGVTDPNNANNQGTATTPIISPADLSVTKTVDTPNPTVGQTINYTVTLTNTGPSTATNVAITDQIPAGLTFVSSTPSQGTYNNTTGLWTVGTVANGAAVTLTITATVNTTNSITNTATVSASDQPDPDTTDNTGTVTVPLQQADLAVAKTVDNPNPGIGQNITYTVTLTNTGPSNATGVQITDQIPAGLTFVSATPSQGTYDNTTGLWTVGNVANGADATLRITGTVNATNVTNTAQVSASDQTDPDTTDNQATVTVPTQGADLSLSKTVDNANPSVGQNLTYTVTLSNTGPAAATGVAVTDQLPAGLTFVSATPSQGTYNNTTGLWTVGNVANGAGATLRITATVNTSNPITNTAQVTASDQPDPDSTAGNSNPSEDDQASASTSQPVADLSLAKTVDNANPSVGQTIAYTVTLSNTGPANATGVQVTEQLPTGLTFVSATPSQGTYNNTTGLWTVGNVTNGSGATLIIRATLNTAGVVTNTAAITAADQSDPDSTPGNNVPGEDDQASVSVPAKPNLRLVKRVTQINSTGFNDLLDDPADVNDNATNWPSNYLQGRTDGVQVQPSNEIEYTIYFLSDGATPAGNVVLCDLVPPNMGFIPNAFGEGQGISVFLNGNQQSFTNNADGDGGQFYPAGTLIPPPPGGVSPQPCGAANTNGAVVVNLGTIPTATGSTPANSYGFIRFRARFIE